MKDDELYLDFDASLQWCLDYNVEIDPDGAVGRGVRLFYYFVDKDSGETIEVSRFASSLIEAVVAMRKEIGKTPKVGIFKK